MILDTTRAVAVSNAKIYYFLTAGGGPCSILILFVIISEIKLGDARELLSATEKKKKKEKKRKYPRPLKTCSFLYSSLTAYTTTHQKDDGI